jgi:hypothetical protein
VDLWDDGNDKVSTETAILVIDAALRTEYSSAQLVAAELLCRNADRLDPCQSLHWPSVVEGCWKPEFTHRTKLLMVEALLNMTLSGPSNESALRSVAVRLYGIWRHDSDPGVRGCIGKLINVLIPRLVAFNYKDFMQGPGKVTLDELEQAAKSSAENPDGYLNLLSTMLAERLEEWSKSCTAPPTGPGYLATAAIGEDLGEASEGFSLQTGNT